MLIITTSKGVKMEFKPITYRMSLSLVYCTVLYVKNKTLKEISNKIKKNKNKNSILYINTCMNIVFVCVFIYTT